MIVVRLFEDRTVCSHELFSIYLLSQQGTRFLSIHSRRLRQEKLLYNNMMPFDSWKFKWLAHIVLCVMLIHVSEQRHEV